jgi:pilus assembly protein Flp/PilA
VEKLRSLPIRAYLAVAALKDREEGQALVEYALLLSLIAVVSIGVLTALGKNVSTIFSSVNNSL